MSWIEIPLLGERLESVRHLGSGKDAELVLAFAKGSVVTLPVRRSRIEFDSGTIVDVMPVDDVSLCVEYAATDLYLRSGRFGYLGNDDDDLNFLAEARSWLAAGCVVELPWVVDVEMCLASGPPAVT